VLGDGFRRMGSATYGSPPSDDRDGTFCLFGSDPYSSNRTTRMPATVLSSSRLLCRSPPFVGVLAYHRRPVPVSVILNGDDWTATPACEWCHFTYYDAQAARVVSIDTWGGPVDGGTWVRVSGRLLASYRRPSGDLSTYDELVPFDGRTSDQRTKHMHQLQPNSSARGSLALWTPYAGPTSEGGAWVLQCRFGGAGHSDAVLTYESSYAWDAAAGQMRASNYSGVWDEVPLGGTPSRPEPVVWCQSPPLREPADPNSTTTYNGGHSQWVTLDLTLNGQQYLRSSARGFFYFPRDTYHVNCTSRVCLRGEASAQARGVYRGIINTTATGRACQAWSEQAPHAHTYTADAFPDAGLGSHNYCRLPGGLRHAQPWCFTTDTNVRWEVCQIDAASGELTAFGGVRVERIHPFGGPMVGGTSVTLIGRYFRRLSHAPILCNFGNSSADAAPLGGPARTLTAEALQGRLPWHVPATLLNSTHAVCTSPPITNVSANVSSYVSVPLEVSLNGQLADRTGSTIPFEYYSSATLSVRWLYPIAGPKRGGTDVTVYGMGFKGLGLDILSPPSLRTGFSTSRRGLKCIFGDLPMVDATIVYPIGSDEARPALGDDPSSATDDVPLAAAISCVAPPWNNRSAYYAGTEYGVSSAAPRSTEADEEGRCSADDDRALCEVEQPRDVCVRVTLNDDPMQHSNDCVPYTYFDL